MNIDLESLCYIAICFIILLLSHYLALKTGWRMGSRTEPVASFPAIRSEGGGCVAPDIYDEERLDFD